MRNNTQRTLKTTVFASGLGLHNGRSVQIALRPAPANHGIVFRRTDLGNDAQIKALWRNVGETTLSTALVKDGIRVATIEHLMSALAGLGVDNAIIELDKDEVPIMDGSANSFVFLIKSAGILDLPEPRSFIRVEKTVRVGDESSWIEIAPFDGYRMDFKLVFDHPFMKKVQNSATIDFVKSSYVKEVSRARTFGFLDQVDRLREMGFARGGNMDNAIVLDNSKVLNKYGLRYREEFVLHKILDAVGDLYLLGHPINGRVRSFRSGHRLNNLLLREMSRQGAYTMETPLTKSDAEQTVAADFEDARYAVGG